MARKSKPSPIKVPSAKADDQPATRRMLKLVKDELKEHIGSVRVELKGELGEVKADLIEVKKDVAGLKQDVAVLKQDVAGLKSDVVQIKKEIRFIKKDICELKVEVKTIKGMIHKTNLLVEEQNANNRIVLEGLQAVWQRQDWLETKVTS